MARPCDCAVCTGGAYGAYIVLLHQAQADKDAVRRQQAHDLLGAIAPYAGSIGEDGGCPGDDLAAPVLDRLYPAEAAGAAMEG